MPSYPATQPGQLSSVSTHAIVLILNYHSIGHVSGPKGCVVRIQDAVKKPWPEVGPAETEAATA